jgi:hypothetical protein
MTGAITAPARAIAQARAVSRAGTARPPTCWTPPDEPVNEWSEAIDGHRRCALSVLQQEAIEAADADRHRLAIALAGREVAAASGDRASINPCPAPGDLDLGACGGLVATRSSTTVPSIAAVRAASVYLPAHRPCGSGSFVTSCAAATASGLGAVVAVPAGCGWVVLPTGATVGPACEVDSYHPEHRLRRGSAFAEGAVTSASYSRRLHRQAYRMQAPGGRLLRSAGVRRPGCSASVGVAGRRRDDADSIVARAGR